VASATVDGTARLPVALPPGSQTAKARPRPRQVLNSVERGASELDTPLSSLGAAAFNNPYIFGEPARSLGVSCNTCHDKSGINRTFFIPGLSSRPGGVDVTSSFFTPHSNNAVFDPLDIPDLRGIRFTAPYGRNGRFASLRDFVRNVIVNEFNGDEPDPLLVDSMIVYMNEFDFLRNPALNRDGTLNARASKAALRGEKIFNTPFSQFGGGSCATCHMPSANFLDHLRHDIGTVSGYADFSRDRALDTPTLLGVAVTPPYFHDGSQPDLRGVVEWFNRQYSLGLSQDELADLTSYVATVGNGLHAFASADQFLEEDLEDQESFLASFEFLAERGKWDMLTNLFRGSELELQHLAAACTPAQRPILEQLALLMREAAEAGAAGQFETSGERVRSWRELYHRHRYDLK
jgi:cytochrome c peroxidase